MIRQTTSDLSRLDTKLASIPIAGTIRVRQNAPDKDTTLWACLALGIFDKPSKSDDIRTATVEFLCGEIFGITVQALWALPAEEYPFCRPEALNNPTVRQLLGDTVGLNAEILHEKSRDVGTRKYLRNFLQRHASSEMVTYEDIILQVAATMYRRSIALVRLLGSEVLDVKQPFNPGKPPLYIAKAAGKYYVLVEEQSTTIQEVVTANFNDNTSLGAQPCAKLEFYCYRPETQETLTLPPLVKQQRVYYLASDNTSLAPHNVYWIHPRKGIDQTAYPPGNRLFVYCRTMSNQLELLSYSEEKEADPHFHLRKPFRMLLAVMAFSQNDAEQCIQEEFP